MRFTLTVFPDGRALLSTPDDIGPDEAQAISRQWDQWKESDAGLAIMARLDVQHASSVEIELPVPA